MTQQTQAWRIEYYLDSQGRCDIEKYINGLRDTEAAQVAMCLLLLEEYGSALGMPYSRMLKGHKPLRELRPGQNRLIYYIDSQKRCIVVVAFRKKGMKTPGKHIARAERRRQELLEREQ